MRTHARIFKIILSVIIILATVFTMLGCGNKVDREAVYNTLMNNVYTTDLDSFSGLGLSDPSSVGINETEASAVRYPVPADSECAMVYNAIECGFIEGDDSLNSKTNNKAFLKLVKQLKNTKGIKKVVFPAGTYCFSSVLSLSGLSDVYFCSDSPDKQYEILMTAWCQGVVLENCNNIHFNNNNFDYKIPSTVSGTVLASSLNDKSITIKIDDEFDLSNARYSKGKINYGSYMEFTKDESTGKYYPNLEGNLLYNSTGDQIKSIENGSYNEETHELKLTFTKMIRPEKGTRVGICYTMYEYFGYYAKNCENLYMETVNIYHTMGMAIGADYCKNLYLNMVSLALREGSSRLVTATADGFHTGNTRGEIVVTGCRFESSHDDCMNIKNTYQVVTRVKDNKLYLSASIKLDIEPGDKLDIFDDMNMAHVGTYTVADIKNGTIVTLEEEIQDGEISKNAYVCNSTKTASLTINNCYFGNKRNRGMLIQTQNVEIANCVFQNLIMGPINIFSTPGDIFHEGVMPKNVVVKNNKFINCAGNCVNVYTKSNGDLSAPGALVNVEITNNFFTGNKDLPIRLLGTGDVQVKNNLIYFPFPNTNIIGIEAKTSENVTISGNRFHLPEGASYVDINAEDVTGLACEDNELIFVSERAK